jgi:predicted DNA-binding transcriptional regulator YafY
MTKPTHDTLVYRLSQILVMLNQGEKLDPKSLAEEFGVNLRTIQRDLNERFAYLPIEKIDGWYLLNPAFLGKLNTKDIERFASLAGIKGLFPSLNDDFLKDIFDSRMQEAFLVKGHNYEDLQGKEKIFRALENAIVARFQIEIIYSKTDQNKHYTVAPYKLINHKGIWYLMALDQGKLKSFSLSKIQSTEVTDQHFDWNAKIDRNIIEDEGIWQSEATQEIVLQIKPEIAGYFKRRKLIANQVIEKELADGGLIVSAKIGHANQILPIVRYWIPNIRIIDPSSLQVEMERFLKEYLGQLETTLPQSQI